MNAAWMDSSVREYEKSHINVMLGLGEHIQAPVLRDVHSMGLKDIAGQVCGWRVSLVSVMLTNRLCCCVYS